MVQAANITSISPSAAMTPNAASCAHQTAARGVSVDGIQLQRTETDTRVARGIAPASRAPSSGSAHHGPASWPWSIGTAAAENVISQAAAATGPDISTFRPTRWASPAARSARKPCADHVRVAELVEDRPANDDGSIGVCPGATVLLGGLEEPIGQLGQHPALPSSRASQRGSDLAQPRAHDRVQPRELGLRYDVAGHSSPLSPVAPFNTSDTAAANSRHCDCASPNARRPAAVSS